ncbi:MAG: DNA recombination protein RmuC [Clostridiaceae bacterium]|nr:DNA recombination protein RmuC [Clostridiaceae bacterium]
MEWIILAVGAAAMICALIAVLTVAKLRSDQTAEMRAMQNALEQRLQETERSLAQQLADGTQENTYKLASVLADAQKQTSEGLSARLDAVAAAMTANERRTETVQQTVDRRLEAAQLAQDRRLDTVQTSVDRRLAQNQENSDKTMAALRTAVEAKLQQTLEAVDAAMTANERRTAESQQAVRQQLEAARLSQDRQLEALQTTIDRRMLAIQEDTGKRLDEMRLTVDEKLQATLENRITKSFQVVNERLEQVYRGLGEMQTLAAGVGDLKKVLSNVKTRGILGEVQLGAILEEILSPEQYDTNVVTRKGSGMPVEYAVKLPGTDGSTVYLPIDAKFPGDTYAALQNAYESADAAAVESAAATLVRAIRGFAKDIHDKYIDPPNTTEFGILFLPFEGLYAEAVRRGLVETLQREYRVTLAGPTTLAALLNALQMGFRTLAIQKRSSEVWSILGAVKTEFDKFGDVLEATQNRLEQANRELDKLVGVRTRVIRSKLRDVTELSPEDTKKLLDE